jgi:hypothetical protein
MLVVGGAMLTKNVRSKEAITPTPHLLRGTKSSNPKSCAWSRRADNDRKWLKNASMVASTAIQGHGSID